MKRTLGNVRHNSIRPASVVSPSLSSSLSLLLFWFLLLLSSDSHQSIVTVVEASIQLPDTGRVYQSRPDQETGLQMRPGLIYPARLQHIAANQFLCDDSKIWNVTVPADGLPVALIVKKGLCSYETKAQYASRNIHPPGVVKFLIIDGETRIALNDIRDVSTDGRGDQDGGDDDNDDEDDSFISTMYRRWITNRHNTKKNCWWKLSSSSSPSSSNVRLGFKGKNDSGDAEGEGSQNYNHDESELGPPLGQFPKNDEHELARTLDDNDVSVALLHVSYRAGYDLLTIMLNESVQVKMQGGTRVNLDGTTPPTDRIKLMMWVSLCVLSALSACCCLAAAISNLLEAQQEQNTPRPQRPQRRRLTAEQVKERIPIGIFNGTDLIFEDGAFVDNSNTSTDDHCNADHLIEEQVGTQERNLLQRSKSFPNPQTLDACTICLEEYSIGEKVRCLPCNHCFHARCICRWLVERSATCPLCKIDLYEEEEGDDGDDGGQEQQRNEAQNTEARRTELSQSHLPGLARVFITNGNRSVSSSWASVPPEARNVPSEQQQHNHGGDGTAPATTGAASEEAGRNDNISWWTRTRGFGRSLFYPPQQYIQNEGETAAVIDSLSEPLLQGIPSDEAERIQPDGEQRIASSHSVTEP